MNTKQTLVALVIALSLLACGCSGPKEETASETALPSLPPTESPLPPSPTTLPMTPLPSPTQRPISPPQDLGFLTGKNSYFTASGNCVICHNTHIDEAGNDVSIGEDWRNSMMANSALDPYYLAGVSMNLAQFPEYDEAIQSKCSSCHMPMAHTSDGFHSEQSLIFGPEGYLNPEHPLHNLAADGNSCTICHQIQNQDLDQFSSFSGGFSIDGQSPMGERALYGRFQLAQQSQRMMAMSSGFISLQSQHILESEICATCHNLYTHYVQADGTFSEAWFPEQTPYSEWLHSDFALRASCQDCHMPLAEGSVVLSNLGPAGPRSPFAVHSFVGGNTYLLRVLKDFGGELGIRAGAESFEAAIDRTQAMLGQETADLELSQPRLNGTSLSFEVTTRALTGHKFPTGYPSRRAWLHVTIKDDESQVIFESGAADNNGSIQGNDNDQDSQQFEPHYTLITDPFQVQIYETLLIDVEEQLTTVLLAAAAYLKDNRLLPAGFDKESASLDIQPKGASLLDEDFSGGEDTVIYQVDVGNSSGPFTVEVELLYQVISYRWAMDLREFETEQIRLFSEYYDATPNIPVRIAGQMAVSE